MISNIAINSFSNKAIKSFDILEISLSVLHNYFDNLTKLFLDLNMAKIFRYFSKIVLFM